MTSGASGAVTSVPAPGPPTSLVWGTLPESKPRGSQFSPTVLSRVGTSEVPVLYPSHKNRGLERPRLSCRRSGRPGARTLGGAASYLCTCHAGHQARRMAGAQRRTVELRPRYTQERRGQGVGFTPRWKEMLSSGVRVPSCKPECAVWPGSWQEGALRLDLY